MCPIRETFSTSFFGVESSEKVELICARTLIQTCESVVHDQILNIGEIDMFLEPNAIRNSEQTTTNAIVRQTLR